MIPETEIKNSADAADVVVNDYAFTADNGKIRVLNLARTDSAAVLFMDGDVLETTMDDIELSIVRDYYKQDKEFFPAGRADA